ncbi:MAG: hypothetical protein M3Q49_15645 [Actinomycetota bacterium]|nr:hypothetical protein [Actinomycetota bacterium]
MRKIVVLAAMPAVTLVAAVPALAVSRSGGPGDVLWVTNERDALSGGSGNDFLNGERDGARDVIDCGAGSDTAFAESVDVLNNCEGAFLD